VPVVRAIPIARNRLVAGLVSIGVLVLAIDHAVALPMTEDLNAVGEPLVEVHLVVSEVMTGGASASDEFIELYNPSSAELPLEGLEVVYVTASGATVTRKASWSTGAPGVPPGAHVLIANDAGVFAGLADVAYANGLAATGGSVGLRVVGAATAIDAVGWGSAASSWLETQPAPAPAAGSSLERLPGGSAGSSQDTDDNLVDFFVQPLPDPQNSGSPTIPGPSGSPAPTVSPLPSQTTEPSIEPSFTATPTATPSAPATPSPVPSASPTPSATPSATPTATPAPVPLSIANARALPDGTTVTVEGVTLTASDFTDGGGYLVDATGGIAVLVSDGAFGRGELMRVTGIVDDRYAQRTIRTTAETLTSLGAGSEPSASAAPTGSIGESLEGHLVRVSGVISSSATTLSTGLAWDIDDGSGPSRILVGSATGIDTSSWERGVGLTLIGVVGQRDSSGSGTSGFRVQPRDAADILSIVPISTPSPSATSEPSATQPASGSESPSPTPGVSLVSISEARAAATGTHLRIRGVVTAQSGLIDVGSAVVQDATGGILVRIGTDVGSLALGQLVELEGTRATKAGMLSLRVATPPLLLGSQADPDALRRATGAVGEREEARVVIVRGAISTAISRPRGGNVSFAIDDGSGPIRVTISSRAGIASGSLIRGAWLEVRAVLAQETTGSAPSSGYRLWPRIPADLRVIAEPVASTAASTCCAGSRTTAGSAGGGGVTDALQDSAAVAPHGLAPILSRPQPTSSPPAQTTTSDELAPASPGAAAGGAVVSGMGLAALAGLAAWFSRRRGPDDDPPIGADAPDDVEPAGVQAIPRLSVLRIEANDAQNERRILPPT
jgi:hypothetical protein